MPMWNPWRGECWTSENSASESRSISSSVNAERTSSRMAGSISSRPKTCASKCVWPISTTNAQTNNFYFKSYGGKNMKYTGTLIAVKDMEKSKQFYHDVLGMEVAADFGANVTLTGGLVLQTLETW